MTNEQLQEEFRFLGVNENNFKVVALLPLVEVAWADGALDEREFSSILEIAEEQGWLQGDGKDVLTSWLRERPSGYTLLRGRKLLVELLNRWEGLGTQVDRALVEDVVGCCVAVAGAAGGFFGLRTVSGVEEDTIRRIAEHLGVDV